MMKSLIISFLVAFSFLLNAQSNSKLNLTPSFRTDVNSGKIITLVADQGNSYFVTIEDEANIIDWKNETVLQTNERFKQIPGIEGFSRGINGACKVNIRKSDLINVLMNTFHFTALDLSKITK